MATLQGKIATISLPGKKSITFLIRSVLSIDRIALSKTFFTSIFYGETFIYFFTI
jgi:hypothetical protein